MGHQADPLRILTLQETIDPGLQLIIADLEPLDHVQGLVLVKATFPDLITEFWNESEQGGLVEAPWLIW